MVGCGIGGDKAWTYAFTKGFPLVSHARREEPGLWVSPLRRGSSEGSFAANPPSKILMYYPFLGVSWWILRSGHLSARRMCSTTGDGG